MADFLSAFIDFFVDIVAAIMTFIGGDSASGDIEKLESLLNGSSK